MIISVPKLLNFFQRSLFSSRHSALSSSGQLHFCICSSANGLGAELAFDDFLFEAKCDGVGDTHDGDSKALVVSDNAVEHRLSSMEGSELRGLWWVTRSESEPGDSGGDTLSHLITIGSFNSSGDFKTNRFGFAFIRLFITGRQFHWFTNGIDNAILMNNECVLTEKLLKVQVFPKIIHLQKISEKSEYIRGVWNSSWW